MDDAWIEERIRQAMIEAGQIQTMRSWAKEVVDQPTLTAYRSFARDLLERASQQLQQAPAARVVAQISGVRSEIYPALLEGTELYTAPQQIMPQWLPITEHMPPLREEILVLDSRGNPHIDYVIESRDGMYECADTFDPTHWMPIPPAPKR